MDEKKVAIVVLILVLLLFVVIVAASSGGGKDRKPIKGYVDSLKERFASDRNVQPNEIKGGGNLLVPTGSELEFPIDEAKGVYVRNLTLALTQGVKAEVRLVPPPKGQGVEVKLNMEAGKKPAKMQVLEGGATLFVKCVASVQPPGCRLQLTK